MSVKSTSPCKKENINAETLKTSTIFVQVVERPARKLILKRGIKAEDYFAYCEEVGCEVWDVLTGIQQALYEPIGMWLPENLRAPGTSMYAQGVEMPLDYAGAIPEGFDCIELPPCKMMIFQGQPYDDANFEQRSAACGKRSSSTTLKCTASSGLMRMGRASSLSRRATGGISRAPGPPDKRLVYTPQLNPGAVRARAALSGKGPGSARLSP